MNFSNQFLRPTKFGWVVIEFGVYLQFKQFQNVLTGSIKDLQLKRSATVYISTMFVYHLVIWSNVENRQVLLFVVTPCIQIAAINLSAPISTLPLS